MKGPLLELEAYKEFVCNKTKSPMQDIIDLTVTLNDFLGDRILKGSQNTQKQREVCNFFQQIKFFFNLMIDTVQDIYERHEIMDLISNFKVKMLTSESIYPDYEALRKILETELNKHRNEMNFDKFDWQIVE